MNTPEVVTDIPGLEQARWLRMPTGYVAIFDPQLGIVSGVLRILDLKRWVPEERAFVISEAVTGRGTYLNDLESVDLGDGVIQFEACLSDDAIMSGQISVSDGPAWVACLSGVFELNEVERRHGLEYLDGEYTNECVVLARGGRELRSPAAPAPCDYLRICVGGMEIAYWDSQEFADDPKIVMGALMGCLANGA